MFFPIKKTLKCVLLQAVNLAVQTPRKEPFCVPNENANQKKCTIMTGVIVVCVLCHALSSGIHRPTPDCIDFHCVQCVTYTGEKRHTL